MIKNLKKIVIRAAAIILVAVLYLYRKFRPIPPRIYFCYNQSIHHIYHSLFVAIELSNLQTKNEVMVFSTSREASAIIEKELAVIPNRVKFIKVHHPGYNKTAFNANWFVFWCRLRMHNPMAVVVTDYFDNVFRQLLLKTYWVYLPHGLINREFGSNPHIHDYDLVILPSDRDYQEMEKRIGRLKNTVVAGYAKLDYFHYHQLSKPKLFKETKPIVIYNPHFDEQLSSFYDQGQELLKALSATGKYNVIFMPHPDLASKYPALVNLARQLTKVIVVDRPSINLDYFSVADLYITDVSSSVFEWLYFHKPALFFNTKKADWRHSQYYPSWILGAVAEDIPVLLAAVGQALQHPEEYQEQREEVFNRSFANKDKKVSRLIAEVIWNKLKQG
jgi:hypothetical protein